MYARFGFGLNEFLKKKLTFDDAKVIIKKRMQTREESFLRIIRKGIFGYKHSPYLQLLRLSNFNYDNIEKLVMKFGIEETLKILKEEGVYFTIEEFKGKKTVRRRGRKFIVKEKDFDNPFASACYEKPTGGTRSLGGRIRTNWDYLSDKSVYRGLIANISDLSSLPHLMIQNIFPYGPGIIEMLHLSKFEIYPIRLISLVDERCVGVQFRYKLATFYILYMSRLFGTRFPKFEFINLKDISKVVGFINRINKEYKGCCIITYVSSALRICLAAKEKGISLSGVIFNIAGEPLTDKIKEEIESTGAKSILYYAFTEAGVIGTICPNASTIDDMHFFKDHLSLISYKRIIMDTEVNSFLFTTFLLTAPKILLNVESGDCGKIGTKRCGCPYDDLGLDQHIYHIRSFEKLTAESMTFYGTDLLRIIEEVLPAKFGGSNLDYQLVEEENEKGIKHIIVTISPEIDRIDDSKIINTILNELKKTNTAQRIMAETWFQAETIKIRRFFPILTKAGKLYPLHTLSK